jgi:putative DNA primase/helicase
MSDSNTAKKIVDRALLPELLIDVGDLPASVDKLRDFIAASGRFYDRDGPVEVVFDASGAPVINKLTKNNVVYIAHELCRPVKSRDDRKLKPVTLPERMAQMYLDLRGKWNLPVLSGISTAPLLKENGGIYSAQGYDETTKLWCYKIPKLSVVEKPTRADAEAALLAIRNQFRTFPFADSPRKLDDKLGVEVVDLSLPPGLDESTFLTALLTAVCRQSLWLAPGLLINAPSLSGAGSGKGLLIRSIAMTAYGTHVTPFPPGNDRHEMDKRIVADVLQGRSSLFLDNVNGTTLRSNTLCILLTERPASIRILGVSRMVQLDQAMFVVVTGNGLTISEDLGRRFLVVEFDTGLENPELRPFDSGFLNTIEASRNKLLAAALTIWRWGRQRADDADNADAARGLTLGSFEQWGEWVRDPLLALGCHDPVKRVRDIKERDPERQRILEIFTKWHEAHGATPMRASELHDEVKRAIDPQDHGRQYQARAVGNLVGTRLAGYVLKRFGEVGNSRKDGAQYNLEYRPPETEGDQPENSSASDGQSHPHHPQDAQKEAKDVAESITSEMRMTPRMTRGCLRVTADDAPHPQVIRTVIRTQENGQDTNEIKDFYKRGEESADDADESAHPSATQKGALTDIEAAYQELGEREANSTSGNCIYCGKEGAEPRLRHNGLCFHRSCRLQCNMEMPA